MKNRARFKGLRPQDVLVYPCRRITGPQIVLHWKNEVGRDCSKTKIWLRRPTDPSLRAYMNKYFRMLAEGYRPPGFSVPPRPYSAQIVANGKLLAEWQNETP